MVPRHGNLISKSAIGLRFVLSGAAYVRCRRWTPRCSAVTLCQAHGVYVRAIRVARIHLHSAHGQGTTSSRYCKTLERVKHRGGVKYLVSFGGFLSHYRNLGPKLHGRRNVRRGGIFCGGVSDHETRRYRKTEEIYQG